MRTAACWQDDDYDNEDGFDVRWMQAMVAKLCNQLLMTNDQPPRGVAFQQIKVPQWTNTLVENILKELALKNEEATKPDQPGQAYKYVVNAFLQQNVGAGLLTACATYGEKAMDGIASVKWQSDQLQVQVVIYGMAIYTSNSAAA